MGWLSQYEIKSDLQVGGHLSVSPVESIMVLIIIVKFMKYPESQVTREAGQEHFYEEAQSEKATSCGHCCLKYEQCF